MDNQTLPLVPACEPVDPAPPVPAEGRQRQRTHRGAFRPRSQSHRRWCGPEGPRLVFAPLAWLKLMLLMHAGDTEVGCFGVCSADDPLYVEDLAVPKQYVSMVTVRFDDESVADHFDRMADEGVLPARCGRVWVHTHPGDSATPSAIDEETFQRAFGDADWAVMAIAARGGDTYARLSFSAGPGGSVLLPVSVDWVKWPQVLEDDESEAAPLGPVFERWMDEYGQCVQAEPLRPRAAGSSAVVDDVPGSVLLAAEEQDLLSGGGWDFFDLQDAYALQEMEEADRRRQESWRGAEGGFHE